MKQKNNIEDDANSILAGLLYGSMKESQRITNNLLEGYKEDAERGHVYEKIIRKIQYNLIQKEYYSPLSHFEEMILCEIHESLSWEDELYDIK